MFYVLSQRTCPPQRRRCSEDRARSCHAHRHPPGPYCHHGSCQSDQVARLSLLHRQERSAAGAPQGCSSARAAWRRSCHRLQSGLCPRQADRSAAWDGCGAPAHDRARWHAVGFRQLLQGAGFPRSRGCRLQRRGPDSLAGQYRLLIISARDNPPLRRRVYLFKN